MDRQAMMDKTDKPDIIDPMLATESTEATEPVEPMDRIEPAEPMDRIEPVEPMDRIDPADPIDRIEPGDRAAGELGLFCMIAFSQQARPAAGRTGVPPGTRLITRRRAGSPASRGG
jgi:hypothetical protein